MKKKTISFHMNMITQNFHINREEWMLGKVAKFIVKAAFWIRTVPYRAFPDIPSH